MATPYLYTRPGRSRRTAVALIAAWALLAVALVVLDISLWIAGLLALATLPAVYDLWANPSAGLQLDDKSLGWHSGRRRGEIALADIGKIRLDRGWDFAFRLSVVQANGRRIRLPYECTPPADEIEAALAACGIRTEHHPFSPF